MRTILTRLQEPSTWAALGAFLGSLGIATAAPDGSWQQVGAGIAAAVSIVGAFRKERGSE